MTGTTGPQDDPARGARGIRSHGKMTTRRLTKRSTAGDITVVKAQSSALAKAAGPDAGGASS